MVILQWRILHNLSTYRRNVRAHIVSWGLAVVLFVVVDDELPGWGVWLPGINVIPLTFSVEETKRGIVIGHTALRGKTWLLCRWTRLLRLDLAALFVFWEKCIVVYALVNKIDILFYQLAIIFDERIGRIAPDKTGA